MEAGHQHPIGIRSDNALSDPIEYVMNNWTRGPGPDRPWVIMYSVLVDEILTALKNPLFNSTQEIIDVVQQILVQPQATIVNPCEVRREHAKLFFEFVFMHVCSVLSTIRLGPEDDANKYVFEAIEQAKSTLLSTCVPPTQARRRAASATQARRQTMPLISIMPITTQVKTQVHEIISLFPRS